MNILWYTRYQKDEHKNDVMLYYFQDYQITADILLESLTIFEFDRNIDASVYNSVKRSGTTNMLKNLMVVLGHFDSN